MLTTPILTKTNAFDATTEHTFYFTVNGGDNPTKIRLVIYTNDINNTLVYDETNVLTDSFTFILPANILTNGQYYIYQMQTSTDDNKTSPLSDSQDFICLTQPIMTISNISNFETITQSDPTFEATYEQAEDEKLIEYNFQLFDISNSLVASSGVLLNSIQEIPTTVSYRFVGLKNETIYYIKCIGTTENGMTVETPSKQIFVDLTEKTVFTLLSTKNYGNEGYIKIDSQAIDITGETEPTPSVYYNNEEIDLTTEGAFVKWSDNFIIGKQFDLKIWAKNFNTNTDILKITNNNGYQGIISYKYGVETIDINDTNMKIWVEFNLTHINNNVKYTILSNSLDVPLETDYIFICLSVKDGFYNLTIQNLGGTL